MIISFYEEFPTEKNLEKLKLIDFSTKIYIAAKNLNEFYKLEYHIKKNKKIKEIIYWIILDKKEGYWISPWADTTALNRVFSELKNRKNKEQIKVLLDLEPPYQKRGLKLLNIVKFLINKHTIKSFIKKAEKNNISITTVENSYFKPKLLRFLGLSYNPKKYKTKRSTMFYNKKLIPNLIEKHYLKEEIKEGLKQRNFIISLGCIASGINQNEEIISSKLLEENIQIAKNLRIKEVIIFRLGGLNKNYLKAIKKFV